MAIFPDLQIESKLQIKDRTRLSAFGTFVSAGSSALTDLTIRPGDDESPVSVLSLTDRNLDWQFNDWNGDFDATNNKIDFQEGSSQLTATITPGTYTLSALATEIKTQMDSAGSNTYTVSLSDDRLTISTTVAFSLLPYTGDNSSASPLPMLGYFEEDEDDQMFMGKDSYEARDRVRFLPKNITVSATDGVDTEAVIQKLSLYSVEGDALYSTDYDLTTKKSDILKWVREGRNSFLKFHREAQEEIIDFFRGKGFANIYNDPLRVKDFVKPQDLKQWSTFLTLRLIFDDLSNSVDDIFEREAREFESREMKLRDRYIRVDLDEDGKADPGEAINITSGRLFRG